MKLEKETPGSRLHSDPFFQAKINGNVVGSLVK